jgi:hypothetical protein
VCLHCCCCWFQLLKLLCLVCFARRMDHTGNHLDELEGVSCNTCIELKHYLCWWRIKHSPARLEVDTIRIARRKTGRASRPKKPPSKALVVTYL